MEIRLARHGRHIAIVSIDNGPRLNAMTRQMLSKLGALWDELERDPTCRCIILTGVGERAFTVGADISGGLSAGPETARMVNHALLKNEADLSNPPGAAPPRGAGIHHHPISTVWVKRTTISSTSWSVPMVRDSGIISMSGGIFGMKCVA